MRSISIRAIKGDEILAKDIISENDKILLPVGAKLKNEYIMHFERLGIESVYVEDELSVGICDEEISEKKIREVCIEDVKVSLSKFSYNGTSEECEINNIVEEIINEILEDKNVVYSIAGVRQKSDVIYAHSINVAVLSVLIAIKMNLPKQKVKEIAVGCILHDIGYNGVTLQVDEIAEGSLNSEEEKELKKHVIYGYTMVENEPWLSKTSKEIILSHHEMCDKSGYPFKLDADHMKLSLKIVTLCNDFDSLVYGIFTKKMKVHNALEYILSQSGQKYDHRVVSVFNETVAAYPNGTLVKTNEGDVGIVLRQNQKCPTRPVIRLIQNKTGKRYSEWIEKDLTSCLTLFIVDTIDTI